MTDIVQETRYEILLREVQRERGESAKMRTRIGELEKELDALRAQLGLAPLLPVVVRSGSMA